MEHFIGNAVLILGRASICSQTSSVLGFHMMLDTHQLHAHAANLRYPIRSTLGMTCGDGKQIIRWYIIATNEMHAVNNNTLHWMRVLFFFTHF